MIVGFDLDGCVTNFGQEVRDYLDSIGRVYGFKDNALEPHHWDFYEYWGMDRAEFKKICDDGVDAGYIFAGPLRPGAKEAWDKIVTMGHEIVVITDRQFGSSPNNSHNATIEMLERNGLWYDSIIFSADKTCSFTDVFVEDKKSNYDALIAAGTKAFLIDRAWNQTPGGDARNRISDISDYPNVILDIMDKGFADLTLS